MPTKPPAYRPPGQVQHYRSERERKAAIDRRRPNSGARGYDRDWTKLRARFIDANPVCCALNCTSATEEVDHIIPVKERRDLRLEWSNLRPLCRHHHSQRTAREQSFGRGGRQEG